MNNTAQYTINTETIKDIVLSYQNTLVGGNYDYFLEDDLISYMTNYLNEHEELRRKNMETPKRCFIKAECGTYVDLNMADSVYLYKGSYSDTYEVRASLTADSEEGDYILGDVNTKQDGDKVLQRLVYYMTYPSAIDRSEKPYLDFEEIVKECGV